MVVDPYATRRHLEKHLKAWSGIDEPVVYVSPQALDLLCSTVDKYYRRGIGIPHRIAWDVMPMPFIAKSLPDLGKFKRDTRLVMMRGLEHLDTDMVIRKVTRVERTAAILPREQIAQKKLRDEPEVFAEWCTQRGIAFKDRTRAWGILKEIVFPEGYEMYEFVNAWE